MKLKRLVFHTGSSSPSVIPAVLGDNSKDRVVQNLYYIAILCSGKDVLGLRVIVVEVWISDVEALNLPSSFVFFFKALACLIGASKSSVFGKSDRVLHSSDA